MDGTELERLGGGSTPYDYRMYDRIWQRVSPELEPYPGLREQPALPEEAQLGRLSPGGESELPGAQPDPCCMGSAARSSQTVLAGFMEEELAQRCCYAALARKVSHPAASRLLRQLAAEKWAAVGRLRAAWFLITGKCWQPAVTVDPRRWEDLPQLLRGVYHQEACNGFNYRRAGEETTDVCLKKLLGELADGAYRRAEAVMELLGRILCT